MERYAHRALHMPSRLVPSRVLRNTLLARARDGPPRIKRHKRLIRRERIRTCAGLATLRKCTTALSQQSAGTCLMTPAWNLLSVVPDTAKRRSGIQLLAFDTSEGHWRGNWTPAFAGMTE